VDQAAGGRPKDDKASVWLLGEAGPPEHIAI
jgi:hypothetical protein